MVCMNKSSWIKEACIHHPKTSPAMQPGSRAPMSSTRHGHMCKNVPSCSGTYSVGCYLITSSGEKISRNVHSIQWSYDLENASSMCIVTT